MSRRVRLLLLLVCLGASSPSSAESLFEQDSLIDVELIGPFHTLIENKEIRKEHPFVLRANGFDHRVLVRVRGKSRIRVCEFPPLRINFESGMPEQSVFHGQDKLKLVTHCRDSDRSEKDVLEEYAAYRIFGLLTDVAYRVRLLRLTYTDSDQQLEQDARRHFGFVIEPKDHLSERVGGVLEHLPGVYLSRLNDDQAAIIYVFQYLIGNTDWSFALAEDDDACCHNGDLIAIEDELFYVPYDFDLAGIVNAAYAKPDPSFRMKNVKSRRYRGFCTDRTTLQGAVRKVNALKADILALVNDIPGLSEKDAEQTASYLMQFFDKSAKEDKLLKSFESQCLD